MDKIFNFSIEFLIFLILIVLIPLLLYQTFLKKRLNRKKHKDVQSLLDVRAELDSLIKSTYILADLHNIEIKYYSTLDRDIFIKGNKSEFRQALDNLIKNGIKASQNGPVNIAIHEMLSSVLIVIEDSGEGLTTEQLKRLLCQKNSGPGPEIMVSYNIIKSMSGKVKVVSKPGNGTVFSIILPKAFRYKAKTI